jgi:hypothetical protein
MADAPHSAEPQIGTERLICTDKIRTILQASEQIDLIVYFIQIVMDVSANPDHDVFPKKNGHSSQFV